MRPPGIEAKKLAIEITCLVIKSIPSQQDNCCAMKNTNSSNKLKFLMEKTEGKI